MKILLIEDEKELALSIKESLHDHYIVELAYAGTTALHKAQQTNYDLIMLDLNLPDLNGSEVCRQLREKLIHTPILILTADTEITNKVHLLDMGADDYMVKPFSFAELQARIRALLRRPRTPLTSRILQADGLTLDTVERSVKRNGKIIHLRRKEFDILEYMLSHRGHVVTREMLINNVWEGHKEPYNNTIDVHIKYLRDQVDKPFDKKLIKTVHGLGYKIESM